MYTSFGGYPYSARIKCTSDTRHVAYKGCSGDPVELCEAPDPGNDEYADPLSLGEALVDLSTHRDQAIGYKTLASFVGGSSVQFMRLSPMLPLCVCQVEEVTSAGLTVLHAYMTAAELRLAPPEILQSPGGGTLFRSGRAIMLQFTGNFNIRKKEREGEKQEEKETSKNKRKKQQ